MPRRVRLAKGIFQDAYGIDVLVDARGRRLVRRFPVNTRLEDLEVARADLERELREAVRDQPTTTGRGTLRGDLPRYNKLIESRPSFKADRAHLRAWLPHIGDVPRLSVRSSDIDRIITKWHGNHVSPQTIKHRLRALKALYRRLDGPRSRFPGDGVARPPVPRPRPVPVPHDVILKVAESLKAHKPRKQGGGFTSEKGYARFLVLATTGQRPVQVMRAKPEDVDLDTRLWWVRGAKGGPSFPLPLDDQSVEAWKTFIAAKAFGEFSMRTFGQLLRRHGWPKDVRPYQLRHTFAIDLLMAGVGLDDLQGLLAHRSIETTRQHYAPVLVARLRTAAARRSIKLPPK